MWQIVYNYTNVTLNRYMRFYTCGIYEESRLWTEKEAWPALQKVQHKKRRKNTRRKSKLEKNHWSILRSRTDLAIGIFFFFLFFLANCRVPYEAIKPTFAPPIPVTSGNKGEDGRWATEMSEYSRKRGWDGPQWRKSRKGTPNPLTMIAVGYPGVPFPRFSHLPLLHYESYRPSSQYTFRPTIMSSHRLTADKSKTRPYVSFSAIINDSPRFQILLVT